MIDEELNDEIDLYLDSFYTKNDLEEKLGISRNTLDKYIKKIEDEFKGKKQGETFIINGQKFYKNDLITCKSEEDIRRRLGSRVYIYRNALISYQGSGQGHPKYYNENYYKLLKSYIEKNTNSNLTNKELIEKVENLSAELLLTNLEFSRLKRKYENNLMRVLRKDYSKSRISDLSVSFTAYLNCSTSNKWSRNKIYNYMIECELDRRVFYNEENGFVLKNMEDVYSYIEQNPEEFIE